MGRAAGKLAARWMPMARAAGRAASSAAAKQSGHIAEQWVPTAKAGGKFVKHVVPAVAKPIHALWHQALGFLFLLFAGIAAWKVWRNQTAIEPAMFVIAMLFIVIMAGYGISSIRKSQRISRS
jgi:uncharacterized membrane protein